VAERERVVGTMVDSPSDAFGEGGLIFLTLSDFRHAPTFPRKSSHRGARETVGCRPDSASGGARVGYVLVAGQLRVLGGQGNVARVSACPRDTISPTVSPSSAHAVAAAASAARAVAELAAAPPPVAAETASSAGAGASTAAPETSSAASGTGGRDDVSFISRRRSNRGCFRELRRFF
jgi:hypothetical protein